MKILIISLFIVGGLLLYKLYPAQPAAEKEVLLNLYSLRAEASHERAISHHRMDTLTVKGRKEYYYMQSIKKRNYARFKKQTP